MSILRITNLSVAFKNKEQKYCSILNNISLNIKENEIVGLVGESGSGKSLTALSIMQLLTFIGAKQISGQIKYKNQDICQLSSENMRQLRGKELGLIMQDPFASLNPRQNIKSILEEGLKIHYKNLSKKERMKKIISSLNEVGLQEEDCYKYPHEFSGGQQQRISIARSLLLEPKLLILDEPTSSLDVSIQAKIIKLLKKLKIKHQMTYLFISHDLNLVYSFCDRVYIMEKGVIIEEGTTEQIFKNPKEEYTKKLISAIWKIPNF